MEKKHNNITKLTNTKYSICSKIKRASFVNKQNLLKILVLID